LPCRIAPAIRARKKHKPIELTARAASIAAAERLGRLVKRGLSMVKNGNGCPPAPVTRCA
jgi:hypothetical protein